MKVEVSYDEDTQLVGLMFGGKHTLDLQPLEAIQLACVLKECVDYKIGCTLEVSGTGELFVIPDRMTPHA